MRRKTKSWSVAQAKAKLSWLMHETVTQGPQVITRRGQRVVVVAAEEWERKTHCAGNLAEFLAASPLRGSKVRVKRDQQKPREVEL